MSTERPLVGCALHDGADIDACGCPALDSPGAIAYRGLLAMARAEIARLTAELAAARAVPADVEAAIEEVRRTSIAAGRAVGDGWSQESERRHDAVDHLRTAIARAISDATAKRCPTCHRDTCPRHGHTFTSIMDHAAAASDCESHATAARGTVGGLLATAPNLSDDEGQYVANRIGLTYELSTDAGRGRAIKAMRAAEEIIARGPLPKGG